MKILFCINTINGGGAERVMVNLCAQFVQDGFEVVLLNSIADPPVDYPVDPRVKRIVLMSDEEWNSNLVTRNITLLRRIKKALVEEQPDVAVSFMGEPNFRMLALRTNVPRIISIRNDPNKEYGGLRGRITKMLFGRAKAIVCQTNDVVDWLPASLKDRAVVIMNQVNPKFFDVERGSGDYYVATGRLSVQKNNPLMINAFHEFLQQYPDEHLRIYGEGGMKEELQSLIDRNGDTDNIHLMGYGSDMPAVLAHAKGFLLTSDYEGMPNGLLEALAAGLPCVSTDCPCGGPKMVVQSGVNGILVPVGDPAAVVKALVAIQSNPQYAEGLGAKAKESARRYAPDAIYQDWKKCIINIVGEHE